MFANPVPPTFWDRLFGLAFGGQQSVEQAIERMSARLIAMAAEKAHLDAALQRIEAELRRSAARGERVPRAEV